MANSADGTGKLAFGIPSANFEEPPRRRVPGAYLFTLVPSAQSRTAIKWPGPYPDPSNFTANLREVKQVQASIRSSQYYPIARENRPGSQGGIQLLGLDHLA